MSLCIHVYIEIDVDIFLILRLINNIFPGILIRLFLTDKLSTYFHKCATDGKLATRLLTNIYSPKYKRFVFSRISSTCLCNELSLISQAHYL